MNQQLNTMNVERLIMKVKENSAIYDPSDRNHSNRYFIASVWRKIGDDLGISGDQLQEKWHHLHSIYLHVKRNEKNRPSGSGAKAKTKWPYYDLLSFLDQFSESRNTAGNVQQESPHQPPSLRDELEYETGADENEPEEKIIATDPDRIFLLSLLPLMKQLTSDDNMDLKLYTLQFLKSRINPIPIGHNNWLQPQPPEIYQNQHYHQLSESDLTFPGLPTSHCNSVPFSEDIYEGPSPSCYHCTNSIKLISSILFSIIFIAFAIIVLIKITSSK